MLISARLKRLAKSKMISYSVLVLYNTLKIDLNNTFSSGMREKDNQLKGR